MHLAILGPIAVGKTAVGTVVAQQLGLPWIDSDDQIAAEYGETGGEIAGRQGVDTLHRIELHMLQRAIEDDGAVVMAPAASVVDTEEGRATLARDNILCVLLYADLRTLLARVSQDDHRRPISRSELDRLLDDRMPTWEKLAAEAFRTDERQPAAIADDIVKLYRTHA